MVAVIKTALAVREAGISRNFARSSMVFVFGVWIFSRDANGSDLLGCFSTLADALFTRYPHDSQ